MPRGFHHFGGLFGIDKFFRKTKSSGRAQFHFHKDECLALLRNQINFAALVPIIFMQNLIPFFDQVIGGKIFSRFSFGYFIFHKCSSFVFLNKIQKWRNLLRVSCSRVSFCKGAGVLPHGLSQTGNYPAENKRQKNMQTRAFIFQDLGLIDYQAALEHQLNLFNETISVKNHNRESGENLPSKNHLLFCEHPHVFTLGKSGDEKHLLLAPQELAQAQATYFRASRGGDITYHGPGQIVAYPILDLDNFFTDIHRYMRSLEEAVIRTLAELGIAAGRIEGLTGAWLDWNSDSLDPKKRPRKICAMGVKISRWVTMHGLALNVNTDINYFNYIVPCGVSDKGVTSVQHELNVPQDIEKIKAILKNKIAEVFGMKMAENGNR